MEGQKEKTATLTLTFTASEIAAIRKYADGEAMDSFISRAVLAVIALAQGMFYPLGLKK